MARQFHRRDFIKAASASGFVLGGGVPIQALAQTARPRAYTGPNVVIVRFGGGVRRRETIDTRHTFAPNLRHRLAERGTLFRRMEISTLDGVATNHGQGTLFTLTGKYDKFEDIGGKVFGSRFEARVPTVFEYLRQSFDIPVHRALIVNGEDRRQEEFFTFGNHHLYGVNYRSEVLSLYRFKTFLLRRKIAERQGSDKELAQMARKLEQLESIDYRRAATGSRQPAEIEAFWQRWRQNFGDSGLMNPRGDQLLTELTLRALRELRPALLMVNYQDTDYVHWGNPTHYTRGISVIDRGIAQIVAAVDADPEYRDNTVFVILPDCGRDDNPLMAVPFQHHFGTRSAHEIWALLFGPGIGRNLVVDKPVEQISIAATVGRIMGFDTPLVEGPILADAFA